MSGMDVPSVGLSSKRMAFTGVTLSEKSGVSCQLVLIPRRIPNLSTYASAVGLTWSKLRRRIRDRLERRSLNDGSTGSLDDLSDHFYQPAIGISDRRTVSIHVGLFGTCGLWAVGKLGLVLGRHPRAICCKHERRMRDQEDAERSLGGPPGRVLRSPARRMSAGSVLDARSESPGLAERQPGPTGSATCSVRKERSRSRRSNATIRSAGRHPAAAPDSARSRQFECGIPPRQTL